MLLDHEYSADDFFGDIYRCSACKQNFCVGQYEDPKFCPFCGKAQAE